MTLTARHISVGTRPLDDLSIQKPGEGLSKNLPHAPKNDTRDYIWDQTYPDTLRSDIADLLAYFTAAGKTPKTEINADILRAALAIGQFFEHTLGGHMPAQSRSIRTHLTTWITDFADYTGTTHIGLGIQGIPYLPSTPNGAAQIDGQHFMVPLHPGINETHIMLGGNTSSVRLDLKMQGGMTQSTSTRDQDIHGPSSALLFSGKSIRIDDVYKNKMHGLRPDIHLLRTLGADITLYSGVVQGMAALLENPSAMTPDFVHGLMTFTDRLSDIHDLVLKNGLDPAGALLSPDMMTAWPAQDIAALQGLITQMTDLLVHQNLPPTLITACAGDLSFILPAGVKTDMALTLNTMKETAQQHIKTTPGPDLSWTGIAAAGALSLAFGQTGRDQIIIAPATTMESSTLAIRPANDAVFGGPSSSMGSGENTQSSPPSFKSESPSPNIITGDIPTITIPENTRQQRNETDFAATALAAGLMMREPDMTATTAAAAPSPISAQITIEAPRASPESAPISMPAAAVISETPAISDIPLTAASVSAPDTSRRTDDIDRAQDVSVSPPLQNHDAPPSSAAPIANTDHPDPARPPMIMGANTPDITAPDITSPARSDHSAFDSFADTPKNNVMDPVLPAYMFGDTPRDPHTIAHGNTVDTQKTTTNDVPVPSGGSDTDDPSVCAKTGQKGCHCKTAFNEGANPALTPEIQERIARENEAFKKVEEEIFGPKDHIKTMTAETIETLKKYTPQKDDKGITGIFGHRCDANCNHDHQNTSHTPQEIKIEKAQTVDNPEELSALLKNRAQGRARRSARKNDETPSPTS